MTPRRRALASVLLAVTTTAGLSTLHVPAAQAATGSAPVTAPDAVTVYAGGMEYVDPLENDSDPDGDDLAVCRSAQDSTGKVFLISDSITDTTAVFTSARTKPGTYVLTYYACDLSYLTPGTITVTVEKAPQIKAVAVKSRPGLVRFRNPAAFAVTVAYGSRDEGLSDGTIKVAAGKSATVRVHHERLVWVATGKNGDLVDTGRVSVQLPTGDRHPPVADGGSDSSDSGTITEVGVATRPWFSRTPAPR